jgi:hypothetical protein
MKTFFSQNRILIWVILFLLLLNISAISSIIYHRVSESRNTSFIRQTPFQSDGRMRGEGRFLRDFLELEPEQFKQFGMARHAFQTKAWDITQELREKKIEFLKELNQKTPDTSKIQQISEDIGNLHKDLRLETGKYYLELREICDKEQQQKLYHFFMQTFERPDMVPHPGRGRDMHQRMMKHSRMKQNNDSI